jgi:uncharacterized protein
LVRFRYLTWSEYGDLVAALSNLVTSSGREFDVVGGIARGGLPVALAVADELEATLDFVTVKSYTGIAERKKPKILRTVTESVKGRRVLVVDDIVDHGETMEAVVGHLRGDKPRTVRTAAIFTKPWSRFDPDFSLREVSSWVVFPYERREVDRLRGRGGKRRRMSAGT